MQPKWLTSNHPNGYRRRRNRSRRFSSKDWTLPITVPDVGPCGWKSFSKWVTPKSNPISNVRIVKWKIGFPETFINPLTWQLHISEHISSTMQQVRNTCCCWFGHEFTHNRGFMSAPIGSRSGGRLYSESVKSNGSQVALRLMNCFAGLQVKLCASNSKPWKKNSPMTSWDWFCSRC